MKVFNNVKTVKFTANFNGVGCVNADSAEQKFFTSKAKLFVRDASKGNCDNYVFAKKQFVNCEDGSVKFLYKVSSECLRHEIFKETMPGQNPNIVSVPYVLYNAIAMPDFISRGYCYTRRDKNSLKRGSALTITDAVEVGPLRDTMSFDFHSATVEKSQSENENGKSSTSIYNLENVGNNKYVSKGFINLDELQFISDDPTYDRMSLGMVEEGSENEKIYLNAISRNMVNMPNPKMDYYYSRGSYHQDEWGERGLLLNRESVDMMVKRMLKSILNISITRRNAYFNTESLEIEVVMADGTSEVLTVTSDMLDELEFNYDEHYILSDEEKIKANAEKFNSFKNEDKASGSKKKSSKKEDKE